MVGNRFRFDAQGDGPAIYTILNYQPDLHYPFKHFPKSDIDKDLSSRNDYKEVGRWYDGKLEIDENKLFWRVNDVENGTITPTPLSVCSLPCQVGFNKQLIKVRNFILIVLYFIVFSEELMLRKSEIEVAD